MNSTISKTIRISSYFALALATIFSIYLVFVGLDFRDSFYYCCKFLYEDKVDVFFPFTHLVFNFCKWLFGDYMIIYRLCNWLFFYLTCIVLYLFVQSVDISFRTYGLWILSFSIILISNVNTNVFSGESISAFLLSCTFISLYKATHTSRWWLVLLSISVTLCILTQFPNIVVIPILLLTGWLFCSDKKEYGAIVLSVLAALVLYVVIGCCLYGGLSAFVNNIINAFVFNSNLESNSEHSINSLFLGYITSLKHIIAYIKYLSLICILPLFIVFSSKKHVRYIVTIVFVFLQVLFVIKRVPIISDWFNYFIIVYSYAIIFIIVFSMIVLGLLRRDKILIGSGIIPICISLCSPAGSDSGLCLLGCSLFAFVPWLFSSGNRIVKSITNAEVLYLILSLVCLSLCSFVFVRDGMLVLGIALLIGVLVAIWCIPFFKIKRFKFPCENNLVNPLSIPFGYFIIAIMVSSLTIYAKYYNSHDGNPSTQLSEYQIKQLKYIKANPNCCLFVDGVMDDYNELKEKGKTVVFFGNKSFIFGYLAHVGVVPETEFTQADIPSNIDALERYITGKNVTVFLCPDRPLLHDYTIADYPLLNKMLERHGYTCEPKGLYAIFHPSPLSSE